MGFFSNFAFISKQPEIYERNLAEIQIQKKWAKNYEKKIYDKLNQKGIDLLYSPELYKFIKSIIELILYLLLIVSETYTHCELLYKYIYNINILI